MKVKDLKKVLEGFDDDEDVWFTQERYDYVGTTDLHLVTRASIQVCREETNGGLVLNRPQDGWDEDETYHEVLVLSS